MSTEIVNGVLLNEEQRERERLREENVSQPYTLPAKQWRTVRDRLEASCYGRFGHYGEWALDALEAIDAELNEQIGEFRGMLTVNLLDREAHAAASAYRDEYGRSFEDAVRTISQ